MEWQKKGNVFRVDNINEWAYSHCHKPTPLLIDDKTLRVFFGVRDKKNRTRTTYVDLDICDLYNLKVKYFSNIPVLDLGEIGSFDDSGANVSSIVKKDDNIYMYYIGWNPSITVPSRNSIGLAVSYDGGESFEKNLKDQY